MADHLIGVISDTHGLLRPQAVKALGGVEFIIHAGDLGGPEVLAALETIAPVQAVRGNVDKGDWARLLPRNRVVTVGQVQLYILHNLVS
jgi:putative phosphoesterase